MPRLRIMSALLIAVLSIMAPNVNPTVVNLQCEYATRPLAVETALPRLSWNTQFAGKNWKQSAYQILVASNSENLAKDKGDLWDSGKILSDASIQIEYKGRELESRKRCFWKVRVWDGSGSASNWSKPQEWEMGLLGDGHVRNLGRAPAGC